MDEDDFAGLEDFLPDFLPDGAVPTHGLVVIEYLDVDGDTQYSYESLGNPRQAESLGLLDVAGRMIWDGDDE